MKRPPEIHPPLRWLADRADGKLSTPRTAKLAAHLAGGCTTCAARDAALRRTIAALKSGPLEAPPRAVDRSARRLHIETRIANTIEGVRRVLARVIFDGRAAPAFAMRSAPGDERRMLWAMDFWEIDACLVTGAGGSDLLGQVVSLDETAAPAVAGELAARLGKRTLRERLAADGRFTFRGLTPGVWNIEGRVGETAFALPPLVVERVG